MITIHKKRKRTQHHSRRRYGDPSFQLNPITRGGNHSQSSVRTMPVNINNGRHELGLLSSSSQSHYSGGKQRKQQQQPRGGNHSQSLVSTMPVDMKDCRVTQESPNSKPRHRRYIIDDSIVIIIITQ